MPRIIHIKVRELLDKRGWSQKDLAIKSGLTTRTVSELCSGKMKQYPKDVLEKVAETLEIDDIREIIEILDD
ncbi:MAG: helix-turn-helix domain-containing protein [Sporolactobacillus sp.]